MQKLIVLFVAIFLSSCAQDSQNFHRVESKYNKKNTPSERLAFGLSRQIDHEENYTTLECKKCEEDLLSENGNYSGVFKIGDPYEVFGVSYFPQNYEEFEETGTASWYGDEFHGRKTANGETYNMNEMTAAHPTLPLPSMVRITNLRNGKSEIVRVNDRGPFAKNRVIDVSEKAAIALGFKDQGTTQVRVQLLRDETDELLEKLKIKN